MTSKPTTAVQQRDKAKDPVMNIMNIVDASKGELAKVLPKHMTPDRLARITMTLLRTTPKLATCDAKSFVGSLFQVSQLGLEPGDVRGHVYFIPFRNNKKGIVECQVVVGYRGFIELARRSGAISKIESHCVYENDFFDYENGSNEHLIHKPKMGLRGDLIAVYAIATLKDGTKQWEVMSREQCEKIRDGLKYPNPVWKGHFDEMCRKTSVRRLFKYLPTSPEIMDAELVDNTAMSGISQGNTALIDASFQRDYATESAKNYADLLNESASDVSDTIHGEQVALMKERVGNILGNKTIQEKELWSTLGIKKIDEVDYMSTDQLLNAGEALDLLLDSQSK